MTIEQIRELYTETFDKIAVLYKPTDSTKEEIKKIQEFLISEKSNEEGTAIAARDVVQFLESNKMEDWVTDWVEGNNYLHEFLFGFPYNEYVEDNQQSQILLEEMIVRTEILLKYGYPLSWGSWGPILIRIQREKGYYISPEESCEEGCLCNSQ